MDLGIFKSSIERFVSDVRNQEKRLADLKASREAIATAPKPFDEYFADFCAWVDSHREAYRRGITNMATDHVRRQRSGLAANFSAVLCTGDNGATTGIPTALAIYGLLGDQIKTAARSELAVAYPKDTGLPHRERAKALAKLDAEIAEISGALDRLRNEAAAAGLTL